MVKIFVSGFSLDITEMELVQMFDPHCSVVTVKIVRDKKTRICKGYAFLEVATEEDAENAVNELDGNPIDDRFLTVKITREDEVKKKPAPSAYRPNRSATSSYTKIERPAVGAKPKRPRI